MNPKGQIFFYLNSLDKCNLLKTDYSNRSSFSFILSPIKACLARPALSDSWIRCVTQLHCLEATELCMASLINSGPVGWHCQSFPIFSQLNNTWLTHEGEVWGPTRFMGPTWDPPGSCRPQVGPILAPWTLLSGVTFVSSHHIDVTWHHEYHDISYHWHLNNLLNSVFRLKTVTSAFS